MGRMMYFTQVIFIFIAHECAVCGIRPDDTLRKTDDPLDFAPTDT